MRSDLSTLKALLLAFMIFGVVSRANADLTPCENSALNECAAWMAAHGHTGSGFELTNCTEWVVDSCYSDYQQIKDTLYSCQLDNIVCSSGYDSCNASYNTCTSSYNQCKQDNQANYDAAGSWYNAATSWQNQANYWEAQYNLDVRKLNTRIKKMKKVCGKRCKKL